MVLVSEGIKFSSDYEISDQYSACNQLLKSFLIWKLKIHIFILSKSVAK